MPCTLYGRETIQSQKLRDVPDKSDKIASMPKRVVILFSDMGGGHRSAGEAITEALKTQYGSEVQVEMADVLKDYTPFPFRCLPAWYPAAIRYPWLWNLMYRLSNGVTRSRFMEKLAWPVVRRNVSRALCEHPADIYVVVHFIYLDTLIRSLGAHRPPVVTVITDLVSFHDWWYHPQCDLYLVATEQARQRLITKRMAPEKARVVGLPVAAQFCTSAGNKAALRARLGWSTERPVVLVMGGGEGMGNLFEIARAISVSRLDCELAVVAGRNESLNAALQAATWPIPTHVYGFVREMPNLMCAADVLVTKAGPSTLSEAFNAGLPIIVYNFLPGQEDGNANFVEQAGAGLWAPSPEAVVKALRCWIGPAAEPQALQRAAANAHKLAQPNAAQHCAELIWKACTADD